MSDTDTSDSDSGIRFKTTSTRYKSDHTEKYSSSSRSRRGDESRGRHTRDHDVERKDYKRPSSSDRHKESRRRRTRSRSSSRSRSRERRKHSSKHRRKDRSSSRSKSSKVPDKREHSLNQSDKIISSTQGEDDQTTSQQTKLEVGKILDISVSSLSSQDEPKEEATDEYFGPALPPSLMNKKESDTNHESSTSDPKPDIIGPVLPAHLLGALSEEHHDSNQESGTELGPTLPHEATHLSKENESSESELSPFSDEEQSEDDFIGPMPGTSTSRSQLELEQRALEMKLRRFDEEHYGTKSTNVTSREDWMLELPEIRKVSDMGLGARQFRTREKLEIGDRSVWTDTPIDRERKKTSQSSKTMAHDHESEQEQRKIAERDKEQEELIKKHKKKNKRDKSLLEMHHKKIKKEKDKKDSDEPTRRPFDRNIDLHANRFDEAQKKAIYKKAQLLDTRFSSGASKYL